tara:strand:- start:242 stop:706 length:465 start_codon:yes stop_codon:yes gene_type:complete
MIKKIPSLLIFCFLAFGASAWGGLVTSLYKEPWFSTLVKPTFNPPEWIFAPVWITLYLLMAFSIWLIWISPKRSEKIIYIYFIHLLVNGSWSLFFFALHQIFISLLIIVLIIILVLWLIKLYYSINKLSSFLMIPYLIWLGFAFLLNFYILILN